MTLGFWSIAITLTVVAISFLAVPILRTKDGRSSLAIGVAIIVPAFGFGLYSLLGAPGEVTSAANAAHVAANQSARTQNATGVQRSGSVESLIGGLRARLDDNPDDSGGWLLLAQSYRHLGDDVGADAAYQKAKALGRMDPNFESSEDGEKDSQSKSTLSVAARVRGQVSLASEIVDQIQPDDTVFIFAKESRDHRMPVAAIRRPAAALPIDFELTNAQAMIAGTDLADYDSLIVTARISRSGLATDAGTGWEAWSAPTSPLDGEVVRLVIADSDVSKVKSSE